MHARVSASRLVVRRHDTRNWCCVCVGGVAIIVARVPASKHWPNRWACVELSISLTLANRLKRPHGPFLGCDTLCQDLCSLYSLFYEVRESLLLRHCQKHLANHFTHKILLLRADARHEYFCERMLSVLGALSLTRSMPRVPCMVHVSFCKKIFLTLCGTI